MLLPKVCGRLCWVDFQPDIRRDVVWRSADYVG